ncbi:MAG: hypothetical protein V1718_06465 [archaeon]
MKRLNLSDMQDVARKRGGRCLSENYTNTTTKIRWCCAKGHEWDAKPRDIIYSKSWCPICSENIKCTIKEMQMLAKIRNGRCLSEKYIDNKTNLRWSCVNGHEWNATPSSIKNGSTWCPICSKNIKGTIEEMRDIARTRRGLCLSARYIDGHTKLKWRCSKGHEWYATPNHIKNSGSWCRVCSGCAKATMNEMQTIAREHNGKCLSKEYVNAHFKLKWGCSEGHKWKTTPHVIKKGFWCPVCSENAKGTIKNMQKLAKEKGGYCLSKIYINSRNYSAQIFH